MYRIHGEIVVFWLPDKLGKATSAPGVISVVIWTDKQ